MGAALGLSLLIGAAAAAAQVAYQFVDERGITHYVGRVHDVPARFRSQAESQEARTPVTTAPASTIATPIPVPGTPAPTRSTPGKAVSSPVPPRRNDLPGRVDSSTTSGGQPAPRRVWQVSTPEGFVLKTTDREKCERMAAINAERYKQPVVCADVTE